MLAAIRSWKIAAAMVAGCCLCWMALGADPEPAAKPASKAALIEALQEFNAIIGSWRGIGQVKRGSPQGAWQEKAELVWELKPQITGIRVNLDEGKEWKTALLTYDAASKQFTLTAKLPDDTDRQYTGKFEDKRLVLEGADSNKVVHRLTLTVLDKNRWLVLFEKRPEQQSFFTRVGEVAYQRQGTKLAAIGGTGPICVVTGGAGTIAVTYKGKTYYVCCTGCRDAFNDDPEGILADYEKKKAESKTP
jgi:YHS domain-containing protein